MMRKIYHDELDEIGSTLITDVQAGRRRDAARDQCAARRRSRRRRGGHLGRPRGRRAARRDRAQCFQIIARQQPVATDLRVLITSLYMVQDLERMGDLALHVAKIARLRYPEIAVPDDIRDVISQMGEVALSLVGKVADVIDGRDIELAQAIEVEDDSMDALHRKLFTLLLSPNWSHGTEAAIDMTLLGRYYERYADHAVAVARRVVFIVTGERPEPIHAAPASGLRQHYFLPWLATASIAAAAACGSR